MLRTCYALTLIPSRDCHLLSRNQVNVPIGTLSVILHGFGLASIGCPSSVWRGISSVPSRLSTTTLVYTAIKYVHPFLRDELIWLRLSDRHWRDRAFGAQRGAAVEPSVFGRSCARDVRHGGDGSIRLTPSIDMSISRVNIYQELCHEILSILQRLILDDMPNTLRMMRTRVTQLRSLIMGWKSLSEVERSSRLGGIRVELGVTTERVRYNNTSATRWICHESKVFRRPSRVDSRCVLSRSKNFWIVRI